MFDTFFLLYYVWKKFKCKFVGLVIVLDLDSWTKSKLKKGPLLVKVASQPEFEPNTHHNETVVIVKNESYYCDK